VVFGCSTAVRLPSQGPAPPKYIRGFFFGAGVLGFVLDCWPRSSHQLRSTAKRHTGLLRVEFVEVVRHPVTGKAEPRFGVKAHQGGTQSICNDRTPRVSSGPEWAARKETHPARGTPSRDRPGLSQRYRGKRGPSGESNAPPIGICASGCAGRVFCGGESL